MDTAKENVHNLLVGINRYNPENLTVLHAYVEQQAQEGTYDVEANLAVLKLYQFNPSLFQSNIVSLILLKALTNLPSNDFSLCRCLMVESHEEDEQISRIFYLGELLETCNFITFWEELAQNKDLSSTVNGFEESIRDFICYVLNITYQTIEASLVAKLLGDVNETELNAIISAKNWQRVDNNKIFLSNQELNSNSKNMSFKFEIDNLASIMNCG
ncbi:Eukaryotic translation initiation factor 3 subunit K [Trichoplax sp. H2]|nr:Eukaryotic translation initiation factor 3 subunit K [Trichoplax sp. H2]|eukprot:RDD42614.1 Eukaryotic translation initiation factor 3 subunit K [Trichoplax sp. H2]